MNRRWLLIGGGVLVVAALLVAGQLLTSRPLPEQAVISVKPVASGGSATTVTGGVPGSSAATRTGTATRPSSGPRLKPAAPKGPLPAGQPLPPLSSSPSDVISGLASGTLPAGSAYRVILRPWGYGPDDRLGATVLVTAYSAESIGNAPDRSSLRGRDLLLVMDRANGGGLRNAGTYSGVVTFVASGNRLVPVLTSVAPQVP